jgi:PKD repeat protein
MNKLFTFFYLLLSTAFYCSAQNEANKWLFGNNGGLDFNSGSPLPFPGGQTSTTEGSASVSDAAGNLLFYTDGITVWDKTHTTMPNGTGLLGGSSSSQSAMIVLLPGSSTAYYVFTVGESFQDFNYSIVDMTLNGGNGDVTTKNSLVSTVVCEKLCSVRKPNGVDFWIIVHDAFTDEFDAYTLTSAGLNLVPVVSNAGSPNSGDIGYLKSSPDGTKLAAALWNSGNLFELFDFDNSTGIVSNAHTLPFHPAGSGAYGLEFSPNNRYLYCAWITPGEVRQYDLQAGSFAAIDASEIFLGSTSVAFNGALQIGPDQKIYLAQFGAGYLGVINDPNVGGTGCNFVDIGVVIAGISQLGLPNYPSFYFGSLFTAFQSTDSHICPGTCTGFINMCVNATSYIWSFPGGNPAVSTDPNPSSVCYNTPGNYSVTLIASNGAATDTLTLANYITVYSAPPPQGIMQSGDTLLANQGSVAYQWFQSGNLISGATNYFYVADTSGSFSVIATDENGCEVEAVINNVVASVHPFTITKDSGFSLYPSPFTNSLSIQMSGNRIATSVTIYNHLGEIILTKNLSAINSSSEIQLDCSTYSEGIYFIEVTIENKVFKSKFIKQ